MITLTGKERLAIANTVTLLSLSRLVEGVTASSNGSKVSSVRSPGLGARALALAPIAYLPREQPHRSDGDLCCV